MSGEDLKQGLEGLTKIDSFSNILWVAAYWIGIIFILLLVSYIVVSIRAYLRNKKRGISAQDRDDFLDT